MASVDVVNTTTLPLSPPPSRYALFSRITKYPLVGSVIDTSVQLYSATKNSSPIVKRGLEAVEDNVRFTFETYSDVYEPVLGSLDDAACKQLDKIENKAQQITETIESSKHKVTTLKHTAVRAITSPVETVASIVTSAPVEAKIEQVIDYSSQKLQGTLVGSVVDRTLNIVDNIVDAVLPPAQNEEEEAGNFTVLERKSVIVRKLRSRVNARALSAVPANAAHEARDLTVRQAKQQWQAATTAVDTLTHNLVSTATKVTVSRESFQHVTNVVQSSLDSVVTVVASMLIWAKGFDMIEPIVTIQTLGRMIHRSCANALQSNDYVQFLNRLRTDTVEVLIAAASLLRPLLESGKKYTAAAATTLSYLPAAQQLVVLLDSAIAKIASYDATHAAADFVPQPVAPVHHDATPYIPPVTTTPAVTKHEHQPDEQPRTTTQATEEESEEEAASPAHEQPEEVGHNAQGEEEVVVHDAQEAQEEETQAEDEFQAEDETQEENAQH